ncbi:hypothetical protein LshimejAT787_0409920 [Lyophyllum shimeji]|uniref:F-box domain-containing protein n=1 Tax=Lyophyllum shimeji TaxID=47721 RepID=A0A9P3PLL5_LYOSH|nr:hypothetical protein LshimejAT787_0409920 [Lyophyllum shimeji]
MSQSFYLMNLDNPVEFNTGVAGIFPEFFFDLPQHSSITNALWRSTKHDPRVIARPLCEVTPKKGKFPKRSPANRGQHGLGKCPDELIDMVFGHLHDWLDVVCFVTTCQRYYEIGRPHLAACVERSIISAWAGDRLICVGGGTEIDDVPPGALTMMETAFVKEQVRSVEQLDAFAFRKAYEDDEDDAHEDGGSDADSEYWHACFVLEMIPKLQHDADEKYERVQSFGRGDPDTWIYCSLMLKERYSARGRDASFDELYELSTLLFNRWRDALMVIHRGLDDKRLYGGTYVLRNLTTREYVRGDAIRDLWAMPGKPYLKAVRFEHALLVRITWSGDPDLNIRYQGPLKLHRGVWAGHRFDICQISTVVDEEGHIDDWEDVTKDVLEEVVAVFDQEEWV